MQGIPLALYCGDEAHNWADMTELTVFANKYFLNLSNNREMRFVLMPVELSDGVPEEIGFVDRCTKGDFCLAKRTFTISRR